MPRTLPPYRPGLGGNPVGAAVGVQGFVSSTNYLRTNAGVIMPGDVNGFFAFVAVYVKGPLPVLNEHTFNSSAPGALRGWGLYAGSTSLRAFVVNGAGTAIVSSVSALVAGDVGKTLVYGLVYNGGNIILYRAGVATAPVVAVGYTAPSAANRSAIGVDFNAAQAGVWARIVGALYGTGIPQPAEVLAHYNACKASNTMESMGGVGVTNINRWQAKDNLPNAATWTDDIGGMVLNRTGTLSSVIFNPVFE